MRRHEGRNKLELDGYHVIKKIFVRKSQTHRRSICITPLVLDSHSSAIFGAIIPYTLCISVPDPNPHGCLAIESCDHAMMSLHFEFVIGSDALKIGIIFLRQSA